MAFLLRGIISKAHHWSNLVAQAFSCQQVLLRFMAATRGWDTVARPDVDEIQWDMFCGVVEVADFATSVPTLL